MSSSKPTPDTAADNADSDAEISERDDEGPIEPEVLALGDAPDALITDEKLDSLGKPGRDGDAHHKLVKYDPLSAYVQEAKRYPLLSREEEQELAKRYREHGDLHAARKLVEGNLRLVVKIAYEYRRAHRHLLDLVQEGNIGLMQAVKKYDPDRGVKLSSYAVWWIRAYMLKFILNNWRLVKIGTTQAQRKLFFNLKKETEKLKQLGFVPEPKLLAERLDVKEKEVVEMERRLAAPDASFDAPLGNDSGDNPGTRHDLMADDASLRPDSLAEKGEFQRKLREKLEVFAEGLEGRDETIFRDRWLNDEPVTLQELGQRFGVSRERVRQVEKRMLGRLREYLEKELGSAVDIDAMSRE